MLVKFIILSPCNEKRQFSYICNQKKVIRKTKAFNNNVAPRFFTVLKGHLEKKYRLGFRDYVKEYSLAVKLNTLMAWIDPCIALYPTGNVSGS